MLKALIVIGGIITVGLFYGSRRKVPLTAAAAGLSGTITGILCLIAIFGHLAGCGREASKSKFDADAVIAAKTAQTAIGHSAVSLFAGKHLLLITERTDPAWPDSSRDAILNFTTAADNQFSALDEDHLKGETGQVFDPTYTAAELDQLIDNHPDADAVLIWGPVPVDLEEMQVWRRKSGKRPLVAFVTNTFPKEITKFINAGYINALVFSKPAQGRLSVDSKQPTDYPAHIREHYVILQQANLASAISEYPNLLAAP